MSAACPINCAAMYNFHGKVAFSIVDKNTSRSWSSSAIGRFSLSCRPSFLAHRSWTNRFIFSTTNRHSFHRSALFSLMFRLSVRRRCSAPQIPCANCTTLRMDSIGSIFASVLCVCVVNMHQFCCCAVPCQLISTTNNANGAPFPQPGVVCCVQ